MKSFGGNVILKVDPEPLSQTVLCESPYYYNHVKSNSGNLAIDLAGIFCVYLLSGAIEVFGKKLSSPQQAVLVIGKLTNINVTESSSRFLIVGRADTTMAADPIQVNEVASLHIEKPWGYEEWICDKKHGFAFKKIFIKAKTKTSLQFHELKQETNYLFSGVAKLHFAGKKTGRDPIETSKDISETELSSGSVIDVKPYTIHRLEAVTDLLLYEVSTPELDDVIRITDDTNRPSGLISSEHVGKSTVCILAAGKGSRMGDYSQMVNKALLPLDSKAIISHIIEKFDKEYKIVIATGYLRDQVKDYVRLAHPERNIVFVDVENYEGPGSGPGESLLSCRMALGSAPFYFVSCDTLWSNQIDDLPKAGNWMAVSVVTKQELPDYSLVYSDRSQIREIKDKYAPRDELGGLAFTGFGHVTDVTDFWSGIEREANGSGEKQVMDGFISLLSKKPIAAVKIEWTDVGTRKRYDEAYAKFSSFNFSKSDEIFYNVNNRIIKFFSDLMVTTNRVQRVKLAPKAFPTEVTQSGNFYSYQFQAGTTFYEAGNLKQFVRLLDWLSENLWHKCSISNLDFQKLCREFYFIKTTARLRKYRNLYPSEARFINGKEIPSSEDLMHRIDFAALQSGLPYFIHGDLQPDNIVYDSLTDKFTLIDWRQDFAGNVEVGDIYYDFAKLLGGLTLNYSAIKKNEFKAVESEDRIEIGFDSVDYLSEARIELEKRAHKLNLDFKKINLLTGIIYLNMSPLHHYPFDKFLNAIGRKMVFENL